MLPDHLNAAWAATVLRASEETKRKVSWLRVAVINDLLWVSLPPDWQTRNREAAKRTLSDLDPGIVVKHVFRTEPEASLRPVQFRLAVPKAVLEVWGQDHLADQLTLGMWPEERQTFRMRIDADATEDVLALNCSASLREATLGRLLAGFEVAPGILIHARLGKATSTTDSASQTEPAQSLLPSTEGSLSQKAAEKRKRDSPMDKVHEPKRLAVDMSEQSNPLNEVRAVRRRLPRDKQAHSDKPTAKPLGARHGSACSKGGPDRKEKPRPQKVSARRVQCFCCQGFGHLSKACSANAERCRHCAGEHRSSECSDKEAVKCALCSGPHRASSRQCPKRPQKAPARSTNQPRLGGRDPLSTVYACVSSLLSILSCLPKPRLSKPRRPRKGKAAET